ncbi:uncharacterized protein KGF55_002820 [Candida pseudojiufengensis]|uniref:uncharacterized protein n=1 Tax=Candida pseudojiufengensis TaxID=497109 RepID=UPI002224AFD5|nr:uncharacterized protein KGF55_002820 [Candida pseudojiufengensis]KAI5963028.1 hypothetical protein KGF55_002820 [Candida pseudojiufengensis]
MSFSQNFYLMTSHNVLFDPPIPEGKRINVGNNETIIEDLSSIYNLTMFKNLFRIYFSMLLTQYILVYACVPFEDIKNRPAMCLISSIYILVMFTINASMLPLCSTTIPTLLSLRCLFCSFVLEIIGLILNIITVAQCLKVGKMFQVEKKDQVVIIKNNVELYINIFNITAMVFSIFATISVFCLLIICEKALEYIASKIDRRVIKQNKKKLEKFTLSTDSMEKFTQLQSKYFT